MLFCRNHRIRLVNSTTVSLFLIVFRERVFGKATVIRQLVISLLISLNGCFSVIQTFMLLLDTQTKAFQRSVDSVNTIMNNFLNENVRGLAELKMSVQNSLHDLKEIVKLLWPKGVC